MQMKRKYLLVAGLVLGLVPGLAGQTRRRASALPRISVEDYHVQMNLDPDQHEMKVTAEIRFKTLEDTDLAVFEISENLSVIKVSDGEGNNIDFGQDETGPGILSLHFAKTLTAGEDHTVKIEYDGGFDLDRYSRNFTRDESTAYIGMEGTYLLHPSKWLPVYKLFTDRPSATFEVTVPLGMTAIGPGSQMPIITQGITETFGWTSKLPVMAPAIVAGRYFPRKVESNGWTIDCYAREDHIESIRGSAEALAQVLDYYQGLWGDPSAGRNLRLVEVDDRLSLQPGTLGTVFVTHKELGATAAPERALARRAAYQWWLSTVGVSGTEDLWLVDGMSYYAAAMYLGRAGTDALKGQIDNLAVLGLKFENKSAIRDGISLGYGTDSYESVVAGKGASVLNMLKGLLGTEKFSDLLRQYLQQCEATGGSTDEFRTLAEKAYGQDLKWFFAEWIDTTGVPNLQVDYVIYKTPDGFRVTGSVRQDRDLFRMPIELEAVGEGNSDRTTIELNGKSTPFDINIFTWPQQVVIDPDNKILRDSEELQLKVQLTLGDELKEKSDYIGAIRAYEQALKLNPRKSIIHFRLAEVFFEQMNLQASANTFRDALNGDRDPKWIEVWSYIYIGKIYDILGQRSRATAEYNKALNTKDDTNGAQEEAKKWLAVPYTREGADSGKEAR